MTAPTIFRVLKSHISPQHIDFVAQRQLVLYLHPHCFSVVVGVLQLQLQVLFLSSPHLRLEVLVPKVSGA